METQFRITEDGIKELKNKALLGALPIALLALVGGLGMSMYNSDDPAGDKSFLFFIVPILLGVLFFGLRKGINRQAGLFKSYTLTFADGKLLRQQNQTPDIELHFQDVKEIVRQKNGAFAVKGEDLNHTIAIPAQIERIDELERKLSEICEIKTQNNRPVLQKFQWLWSFLGLGLMMLVALAENKLIVGVSGIALTCILIYSLVITQKSKHVDSKTKKSMWLVLIVIFSIIITTLIKVFG